MPFESEIYNHDLHHPRSTVDSSTSTSSIKGIPPTSIARDRRRVSRVLVVPPISLGPASDQPSSSTSSSSSLFSTAPTLSSGSNTNQQVPSWTTSEINRNVLAPPSIPNDPAVISGAASSARNNIACCVGGDFSSDIGSNSNSHDPCIANFECTKENDSANFTNTAPVNHVVGAGSRCSRNSQSFSNTTFSLLNLFLSHPDAQPKGASLPSQPDRDLAAFRRPPLRRTVETDDYKSTPRSYGIRHSDINTLRYDDSDSDGPLTSDTMIGRTRDKLNHEVVRKQIHPMGSAVDAPHTAKAGGSRAAASSPQTSLFPLQDSDLVELLNQDDRPTFIVDSIDTDNNGFGLLQILFANTALKNSPSVLKKISSAGYDHLEVTTSGQHDGFEAFKSWVLGLDKKDKKESAAIPEGPSSSSETFAGWIWTASMLRQRFRVVRGIKTDDNPELPTKLVQTQEITAPGRETSNTRNATTSTEKTVYSSTEDTGQDTVALKPPTVSRTTSFSFDWTRIAVSDDMSAHIQFARSVDWASTPLGPIESWSGDLRIMANMVMASPHPAAMYWGPNYTAIYNEAYSSLAGHKHPHLMGSNYPDSWPEIWDTLKPFFHSAWNDGQAVLKQDNRLFIQRNGFLEEAFFNWSLVPLVGNDGSVMALYNPAFEITRRKVNERRMLTLNEIGEKTATARTIRDFWHAARDGLEFNEFDVPFALLYSVVGSNGSDDDDSDTSSIMSSNMSSPPQVVLEGSIGVPENHPAAVLNLDLLMSEEGFAPYMRQAIAAYQDESSSSSSSPIVLSAEDDTLPTELISGIQSERGFGDPCRTVVVFPVLHPSVSSPSTEASANASLSGFVIMGTNPRQPYKRDYRLFVHLLTRQLTTSLASVVLFGEEVRRSQRVARRAAQDRQELSQELLYRTQQAMESENKFMRMAEFTPVGMFVTDNTGRITYCNDMWWEISRHPKEDAATTPLPTTFTPDAQSSFSWASWMDSVQDEDQPALTVVWDRLVKDKVPVTHEFRFKQKTTIETDGNEPIETTTWVLLRAYPEKDENGDLKGIFGCITDISQQKLAEEFQIQLRKEAVKHKRQQENFIDITSHEMRNPLSAILQTVDDITSCVGDLRAINGASAYSNILDNILEASSTISLCANHQKRIVDDVLTLSKLDSQLLPVTPIDVQPVMVIRGTLKMFEAELVAHGIQCVLRVQPSYQDLVGFGNWMKLDPSRLNQILINLLMNAIKFTQNCEHRSIIVSLGASLGDSDPAENDVADSISGLSYVPSRQGNPELADGLDWGECDLVHLHVAVSDTGRGLDEDEKNVLFQHFSQSLPRTHVQYGGTGLGLYICRNMAELQGGQIGFTSEKDHGSTFAFYVKCRKVLSTPIGVQPGSSNLSSIVTEPMFPKHSSSIIAFASGGSKDGQSNCICKTETITAPTLLPQLPSPPVLIETPLSTPKDKSFFPSPTAEPSTAALTDDNARLTQMSSGSNKQLDELPPLNVLIVEDNIVNQRVLQRQLEKCGNRTMVANHGGEALDILRQSSFWRATDERRGSTDGSVIFNTHPTAEAGGESSAVSGTTLTSNLEAEDNPRKNISVVLMDLEMPVMDGMTCARAIRALERSGTLLRHVPIIAVTAYARQEQIDGAIAAGIDDVISKPFRLAQLMPKIQELVAKYNTVQ